MAFKLNQQHLNKLILFLIPLAFIVTKPWLISELNIWLGYGKHLVSNPHFLYQDSASILQTDNNITSSWLLSLIYYGLYFIGGLFFVAHIHHLILLLILNYIYQQTIFQNDWPWTLKERIPIYLIWIGAAGFFSLRPALIAFIPFIMSFVFLEKRNSTDKDLNLKDWFKLILIQILWVNIHGSFIVLPMMVGWFLAFKKKFNLKSIFGFIFLCGSILLNPFGYKIFTYLYETKKLVSELNISEWASVFSIEFPLQTISFWFLLLATVLTFIKARNKQQMLSSPFIVLVLLPFLGVRQSVFSFMALPIFLKYQFNFYKKNNVIGSIQIRLESLVATLGIIAFIVLCSPYFKEQIADFLPEEIANNFDESYIPQLSKIINNSEKKHCSILNDINVGGTLLFNVENPIFIDGRVTPYTLFSIKKYLAFKEMKNVSEVIIEHNPCFAIFSQKKSSALIHQLINEFNFHKMAEENEFILLER